MIKKLGTIAIISIVLILAYKIILQINDALKSGDRLSSQAETVYELEKANKEIKKKLSEAESPEFIEEEARNKLGLGKNGEVIVIIPDKTLKQVMEGSSSAKPVRLPNYQGWLKVFFH